MSRGEKIAGFALGLALFLGLGYFIYTSSMTGQAGLSNAGLNSDLGFEEPGLADEEPYPGDEEEVIPPQEKKPAAPVQDKAPAGGKK